MRRATIAFALVLVTALGSAACVQRQMRIGANVAPSLIVEQFLRAANARDLDTMARLFGTKSGPIIDRDDRRAVEQRMFAIASELKHTDFEVVSEQMVPGRTAEATQLTVRLTADERKVSVPFTLVRYKTDSWLIEQIGLEVLTSPKN